MRVPGPWPDTMGLVRAVCWSDYICPWCYLGRDRTALLRDRGVDVELRPFELHPELAPGGRPVRRGGRLGAVLDEIGQECDALGIAFRAPVHVPSSRQALEVAEVVRTLDAGAFAMLDDALFRAHFVEGRDIGDAVVLDALVRDSGIEPAVVREAVAAGVGARLVDASMDEARERGIAGTPAWLIGELVLPGAQPRELFVRVVDRLRARTGGEPAGPAR